MREQTISVGEVNQLAWGKPTYYRRVPALRPGQRDPVGLQFGPIADKDRRRQRMLLVLAASATVERVSQPREKTLLSWREPPRR